MQRLQLPQKAYWGKAQATAWKSYDSKNAPRKLSKNTSSFTGPA